MPRRFQFVLAIVPLCILLSCAKQSAPGSGPHAAVLLRDGSSYAGTVVSSSPSQIAIAGDDNVTHTIAMKDVRSVDYGDAPAQPQPQPAPPAPQPQSVPAAPEPPAQPTSAGAPPLEAPPAPVAIPAEPYHENHYHPDESVIRTRTWDLPAGTQIPVRCEEPIDSERAADGQTYAAEVARDVVDSSGNVVIPRGANAQLVIVSASSGGRFRGSSDMVLDLNSVSVAGRRYRLSTTDLRQTGKPGLGGNRRTAEYTGGGAVVGAIIGALAGHGKGAAIGALSGAGAGAATQVLTRGRSIRVPVESVLTFRLDRPLHVEAR